MFVKCHLNRFVVVTVIILSIMLGGFFNEFAVEAGSTDCASRANGIYDDYNTVQASDNLQWLYEAHGDDLLMTIDFSCQHPTAGVTYLIARYQTVWECTHVGNRVTRHGSALGFDGASGLNCTGETVQDAVKRLTDIDIYYALLADDFYVKAHTQPYTRAGKTCVDEQAPSLPVFSNGNIDYRLQRTSRTDTFTLDMHMRWAYKNNQPTGHTFTTAAFNPPATIKSHYMGQTMSHVLDNRYFLGQEPANNMTFYLLTDRDEIKLGYDGKGNFFCGYIIDVEIDPIIPIDYGSCTSC